MNGSAAERLLDGIGEIEDCFIAEAETADIAVAKTVKRRRIAAYSAAGLVVSVGIAVVYWKLRPNRLVKSA